MAVRPIDAVQVLHNINLHHRPTPVSEFESGFNDGLNQAMWEITHAPTLTQPNEPLTLEELREMDGEPVWVTSARERGNIPSRWVLFAGVSKSKRNSDVFVFATTGGIAQGYEAVNYGKTWNAYRRPPEGESDA